MSIVTAVRLGARFARQTFTRGATAARNAAGSINAQRAGALTGAAIVTGVSLNALRQEGTPQEIQETTPTTTNSAETLSKSDLGIIKFPLDIEQAPVPHVLFKIYETETGAVTRTDATTQSFVVGVEAAATKADNLNLGTLAGGAGGAILGTKVGALAFVATGKVGAAAAATGIGAVSGAALVGSGLAGDLLEFGADKLGNLFNIENTSTRFKNAIDNFALKRNIEQLSLAIALLMPETLSVSYQNNYDALSFTESVGGVGMAVQALGSKLGGSGDAANPYIMETVGRLAGGNISEEFKKIGLFATTGRTVNPQLEVIYNSPNLREFTMDFRLVPRNAAEANQIRVLIQQLKYFAAPQIPKDTGGRYFIPPAQFELEFYDAENNQNFFLFKTKKCVLEDISVDFTGNGSFNTFYDGSPVETRLSLRFKETVFIDRDAVNEGY